MRYIDGLFLIVLGGICMFFKAVDYIPYIELRKFYAFAGNYEQDGNVLTSPFGEEFIAYEFSNIPLVIGIVLIVWGILKIGVAEYERKKLESD